MLDPIYSSVGRRPDRGVAMHPTLPEGGWCVRPEARLENLDGWAIRDKAGNLVGSREAYHFCPLCKGFIAGRPLESRVDTLGVLCGRRGVEHCCRRCGYVLHFDGMMA